MDDQYITEAQAIIDVTRQSVTPVEVRTGKLYATPDSQGGVTFYDTYAWADSPLRVQRESAVTDVESFVAYLGQRGWSNVDMPVGSLPAMEIWASQEHSSIVAILDGCATIDSTPKNGWMQDRVTLQLESSPEWSAFMGMSGQKVDQHDFADFLQDWESCIVDPDSATLMEIAQSMTGTKKVQWDSAQWLANGQRSLGWHEEIEAKAGRTGKVEIPAAFTLGLRPFLGSEPCKVRALLRYQIRDGVLAIGLKLVEPQRVVDAAFGDIVAQIRDQVSIPVLMGRP